MKTIPRHSDDRTRVAFGKERSQFRHGLKTSKLPFKGGAGIIRAICEFRRALEDEFVALGREIGPEEACLIAGATSWISHSMKARRWLGDDYDSLTPEMRLTFSREESRAISEASKLVKQLNIARNGHTDSDPWKRIVDGRIVDADATDNGQAASQDAQDAVSAPLEKKTGKEAPQGEGITGNASGDDSLLSSERTVEGQSVAPEGQGASP